MTDFAHIQFEKRGSGAWIIFNQPEVMNSISIPVIEDLSRALDLAENDGSIRAVVLTGNGHAFCTGSNLKASLKLKEEKGQFATLPYFLLPLMKVLHRLRKLPKPVIAAVNGYCMAGGLETVLCCDLVIAAESAKFSDAHAKYGLLPGMGSAVTLARTIGPYRAKELMFTADHYSAADMRDAGLVSQVVADDKLHEAAEALVAKLSDRSPEGLARMKQMVNDEMDMPWEVATRYELAIHTNHLLSSPDLMEGLRAFRDKRSTAF